MEISIASHRAACDNEGRASQKPGDRFVQKRIKSSSDPRTGLDEAAQIGGDLTTTTRRRGMGRSRRQARKDEAAKWRTRGLRRLNRYPRITSSAGGKAAARGRREQGIEHRLKKPNSPQRQQRTAPNYKIPTREEIGDEKRTIRLLVKKKTKGSDDKRGSTH